MPVIFTNRDPNWYQDRYIKVRGLNQPRDDHYPDLEAYIEQLERDYDEQQISIGYMQDTIDRLERQIETYERAEEARQTMATSSHLPIEPTTDF